MIIDGTLLRLGAHEKVNRSGNYVFSYTEIGAPAYLYCRFRIHVKHHIIITIRIVGGKRVYDRNR